MRCHARRRPNSSSGKPWHRYELSPDTACCNVNNGSACCGRSGAARKVTSRWALMASTPGQSGPIRRWSSHQYAIPPLPPALIVIWPASVELEVKVLLIHLALPAAVTAA